MSAGTEGVGRTKRVVGGVLVPERLQQGCHTGCCRHDGGIPRDPSVPFVHGGRALVVVHFEEYALNFPDVFIEEPFQAAGVSLGAEVRFGGVGQHGDHPRVGGGHHEVVAEVEDVEGVGGCCLQVCPLGCCLPDVNQLGEIFRYRPARPPVIEMRGRLPRSRRVHRCGDERLQER